MTSLHIVAFQKQNISLPLYKVAQNTVGYVNQFDARNSSIPI